MNGKSNIRQMAVYGFIENRNVAPSPSEVGDEMSGRDYANDLEI
jgi:hypothetical protein